MKFKSALTAFVACAAAAVSYAATTADYVQDGLIAHWDGIANAGKDNPHDSAATTWVDLVGGRAFTLYNVDIEDNGLYFKGTEKSSVATSYGELNAGDTTAIFTTAGTLGTVELVFKEDAVDFANTQAVLLQAPNTAGVQFSRSKLSGTILGEVKDTYPKVDWVWQDEFESVAVTYKSSAWARFFTNGDEKPASETKSYWAATGTTTMLGTRLTKAIAQTYKGRIYAIRVYNRQLSQEEVVRNAALDAARFLQGDTSPAVFATSATVASDRGETVPAKTEGFNPSLNAKMVVPASGTLTFAAPADEFSVGTVRKGVVTGGTLYEIDGGETNAVATTKTPTLEYESKGLPLHMVWTVAYSDGIVGAKDFYADPVNGDDDYAGEDIGSAEHPFKTLGKAHIAATNHIKTASAKAVIWLAEGRFDQTKVLTLAAGESIIGKGMDKTFINWKQCKPAASGSALLVSHSDNLLASLCMTGLVTSAGTGSAEKARSLKVTAGLVDHCRSAYNSISGNYNAGAGAYITGGTVRFCEFDHNNCPTMYPEGVGVWISGGTLSDSLVHDNTWNDSRSGFGAGIRMSGSKTLVTRCRIYGNGVNGSSSGETGGGVYLGDGTLENCLVYGNVLKSASENAAGVHNNGGTVRHCTICDNKTTKDATGVSGYRQTKGAGQDNIISGNYKVDEIKVGAVVSSGTFDHNLVAYAVAGRDDNIVAADPQFVDAAARDYHISSGLSPAVGKGVYLVATDFDGVSRDKSAPTIGAYEYVSADEPFSVQINVTKGECREGGAPALELAVLPLKADPTITWYLDGVEIPAVADRKTPDFTGAAVGRHTVKAVATYKGETLEAELVDAFVVKPVRVYVNTTGNGTFPFATAETATNSLNAALDALWKSKDEVTFMDIDEGEYQLGGGLQVGYPVVITGKCRDCTVVSGKGLTDRMVTLNDERAKMCGLTLTNATNYGGVNIVNGWVDDCRIVKCTILITGVNDQRGAGVRLDDGKLTNCEIADCVADNFGGAGGGVAVLSSSAVVSNCTIRSCRVYAAGRDVWSQKGGGVYVSGGTLTHCRILDCRETTAVYATGVALYGGAKSVIRNCLIAGNESGSTSPVYLYNAVLENCTVANNQMPVGVPALTAVVEQYGAASTVRNCVIWNGGADVSCDAGSTVSYSCYSNATEGEDGNTASDPKLRGVKHGEYKISSKSKAFRAGTVRSWMTGATDILGNPRLTDDKVDMGCYQVGFDPGLEILVW